MPVTEIEGIKLPSGNTYYFKDAVAREAIAGGVSFIIAWDGESVPVESNIPQGVTVTYNGDDYDGTLLPNSAQVGAFYLVKSKSQPSDDRYDVFDEYVSIGETGSRFWEKFGDTRLNLSDLGTLAYKDSVSLSKGSGDNVLGEATTFTNASSAVSFATHSTDKCLGADATFTTSVTPTTTNVKATATGTAVGASGTDTFVKSYPGTSSKLMTTSIPNVTGNDAVSIPNVTAVGTASTWSFALGTGNESEILIISGANSTVPTLGTAIAASKVTLGTSITAATGSLASNGSGDSVMTGLGTPTTASAVTGVAVTTQPTVSLTTGATAGTGVVSVATGITSATTSVNNSDEVTALTALGAGTAAAQTITVGTNDKVKVAKYSDLSISVS